MTCTLTVFDIYGTHSPAIPATHKTHGYFRIPNVGDIFLSPKGEVCTLGQGDVRPGGPRVILDRKPHTTPEEVYGTEPVSAPKGYTLGEFRLLKCGETVEFLSKMFRKPGRETINDAKFRYTLIPNPTPLSVYGTETPEAPDGYGLGEFKSIQLGEVFLGCGGEQRYDATEHMFGHLGGTSTPARRIPMWRYTLIPLPKPAPFTPKFKKGDKVVSVRSKEAGIGTVRVLPLTASDQYGVDFTNWGLCLIFESYLSEAPATPTQPTNAPEGYFFTGEYRLPKKGEIFYAPELPSKSCRAAINFSESSNWILLPLPPKPTIPGWEAVEFRHPEEGEHYCLESIQKAILASCKSKRYVEEKAFRWIMRPITPPPTPSNRWLIEVESVVEPLKGTTYTVPRCTRKVYDYTQAAALEVVSVTRKP